MYSTCIKEPATSHHMLERRLHFPVPYWLPLSCCSSASSLSLLSSLMTVYSPVSACPPVVTSTRRLTANASGLTPFSIIETQYDSVCLSRCVFCSRYISQYQPSLGEKFDRVRNRSREVKSTHQQRRDLVQDIDDFAGCGTLVYCFARHGTAYRRRFEGPTSLYAAKLWSGENTNVNARLVSFAAFAQAVGTLGSGS